MRYRNITTVDLEARFDTQTHEVRGALDNLREATQVAQNMADELSRRLMQESHEDGELYGLHYWAGRVVFYGTFKRIVDTFRGQL